VALGYHVKAEFMVNSQSISTQSIPSIVIDYNSDFINAWQSLPDGGDVYGVYAQPYEGVGSNVDLDLVVEAPLVGLGLESMFFSRSQ
tara:strand:- start:6131 stop:6391 length:261 start_codon:yes stop_codon:yes gene_type:complete